MSFDLWTLMSGAVCSAALSKIASNRRRIEQCGEQARQGGLEIGAAALEDRFRERVSSRCGRGRLRSRLGLGWRLRGRFCRILILHGAASSPAISGKRSLARFHAGSVSV